MATLSFDLNGTLLDPGEQSAVLQDAVRLAMAHTLAGDYVPFADLIEAAGGRPPDEMAPFSDVPGGLARLRERGNLLVVLTNSARQTAERQLERAGLRRLFERVAGSDEAGAYKPDRRVYDLVDAEWHVAAHWWDVLGADRAGRRTVYVQRGGPLPATVSAELVVASLAELAEARPFAAP